MASDRPFPDEAGIGQIGGQTPADTVPNFSRDDKMCNLALYAILRDAWSFDFDSIPLGPSPSQAHCQEGLHGGERCLFHTDADAGRATKEGLSRLHAWCQLACEVDSHQSIGHVIIRF